MAVALDHAEFRLTIPSQTKYLNLVTGLAKRAAIAAGMDDATAAKVSIAAARGTVLPVFSAGMKQAGKFRSPPVSNHLETVLLFTPIGSATSA